jgi:HSP20 family protein
MEAWLSSTGVVEEVHAMAKMQWLGSWLPADLGWWNQPHPLRMEESRQDGTLTLRLEVPGVDPARDIDIVIDDGVLSVSGRRSVSDEAPHRSEFHYGEFVRTVTLPRGADEDSAHASYHEGILEITMTVPEGLGVVRRVPIDSSSSIT